MSKKITVSSGILEKTDEIMSRYDQWNGGDFKLEKIVGI